MKDLSEHDLVNSTVDAGAFDTTLSPTVLDIKTVINLDIDYSSRIDNPQYSSWQNKTQARVASYGKQETQTFVEEDINIGTELIKMLLLTDKSNILKDAFERTCNNSKTTIIEIRTDDPSITNLPWELCVKADWQSLKMRILLPKCNFVVARIPKSSTSLKWNLNDDLESKVRILVAGFTDDNISTNPPPSFDGELDAIETGLKILPTSRYKITSIAKGLTISDLGDAVEKEQPHILHLIAHGSSSRVEMRNTTGGAVSVSSTLLSSALQRAKESLVMFVSTACLSMKDSPKTNTLGVGNVLVTHIPVVVGMQLEISDRMARLYSGGFYRALASSSNILESHMVAREALWEERKDSPEWVAPVIYQTLQEDKLIFPKFDIRSYARKKISEVDSIISLVREARHNERIRLPLTKKITDFCNSIEEMLTEPAATGKLKNQIPNQDITIENLDDVNSSLLISIINFGNVLRSELATQIDKDLGQRFKNVTSLLMELRGVLEKILGST